VSLIHAVASLYSIARTGDFDSISTLNAGVTWRANEPSNIPPDIDATFTTFAKELGLNLGTSPSDGTLFEQRPAVMLVNSTSIYPDDFTVDFKGNAWIASDLLNQLDLLNGVAHLFTGAQESSGQMYAKTAALKAIVFP